MKIFPYIFLLLSLCGMATAAPSVYESKINDIIVKNLGNSGSEEARDYILSHTLAQKGGFISGRDLAKDQRALLASGLFTDVQIFVKEEDEGVNLYYEVKLSPRLSMPIVINGNNAFSQRRITKLLGFANGDRVSRNTIDAACDKLREEYKKSYYNRVKVSYSLSEPDKDGFTHLSLTINEGEKERLASFVFSGNSVFSNSDLNSVLGRPSPYNPFKGFYSSWRINAFDRDGIKDKIVAFYRQNGYLDATVSDPVLISEDGEKKLKIAINEGSRYIITSAIINGVSLFPERDIRLIVSGAIKPGSPAAPSRQRAAEKLINDFYGSKGYIENEISTRLVTLKNEPGASDKKVALEVNVKEGFLAHIRSIRIKGNTYTKDKVIRREFAIAPGLILNEVLLETSKRRAENLGYFEQVRVTHIPSQEDPALRDVVFDVNEKSTGTLMAGIGTSNIDNILGYVDISQNNFDILNWPTFRGAGQKMRLSASAGSSSNSGEISWTDPWFLDRQQSLTLSVYRRENSYSEYDEKRIGGDASLAVPLRYGRLIAKIGVESLSNDDFISGKYHLAESTDEFMFQDIVDEKYLRVPLRLTWAYDTRNRPFVPTRGSRNNVFVEVQSTSLGSDYDLFKAGVDLRQYFPSYIGDTYFSMRLRAESVEGYSDTEEVPLNERYFLGGARSIRGFRHREVGPKAIPGEETGGRAHPVGGQTLANLSVEYNIPIAKVFRIAAFYDIGNVWEDAFDFDTSEYASSWGFGVRFDIPGFPIRLDYATPLKHDDDYSRTERFIFSIGFE